MLTQRQFDFFHNILRVFITRNMDDRITERVNRLLARSDLKELFCNKADIESLFPEFHVQAKRKNIADCFQSDFWCVYISALFERGDVDVACDLLRAMLKFDWGMKAIAPYLSLSSRAQKLGVQNAVTEKASVVFDSLNRSIANRVFESMVSAGKSVALVGNGPSDNKKKLGKEVDSHDVVIRINNYARGEYEEDFGRKTDIWVKASFSAIDHNSVRYPSGLIFYADELTRRAIFPGYLEAMYEETKRMPVECFAPGFRKGLTRRYGGAPTTGFTLIQWLKGLHIRYLDVYAFSFLDSIATKKYLSFDGSSPDATAHDLLGERELLSLLPWDGRRLWIET